MCGIAGAAGSKVGPHEEVVVKYMLDKIKHRGDSPPQYKKNGNSVLGCVQLRIVDPDNGVQPIYNEDGTIAVVFNGEIYNYIDLKKTLSEKGHDFSTTCDTEVLIHLYEEYRENMLQYLDGMFAFLIFDSKTDSYFAARDYFGVKPFFYCWSNDIFYFSSEMKSFDILPTKEIHELRSSHFIKDGFVKKYYTIPNIIKDIPFHDAKTKVRELIENAVKKRVQTNLPIGVFFSGGVDSTIVLMLCKKYHKNVTALILGHENSDDYRHAIKVCEQFDIKYKHRNFTQKEIFDNINEVIYAIESYEPNPVRGASLSYLLGELAHQSGLKVVLCGEGSDEIFAGYGDFTLVESECEFHRLSMNLLNDLYRTQLLRVDKTAMAFEVEVREPFLDRQLVEFVVTLPSYYKVNFFPNGTKITKYILREAFKDLIPKYVYERPKMTLMEGAGAGSVNRGSGIFFENANRLLNDDEFLVLKNNFGDYNINDREEAYYLKLFNQYFAKAKFASRRTFNALKEIKENEG